MNALINHCEGQANRMAVLDAPPGMSPQQIKEWRSDVATGRIKLSNEKHLPTQITLSDGTVFESPGTINFVNDGPDQFHHAILVDFGTADEATIEEAWSQVSELPCNAEGSLFQGGPCPGPLMVIHSDAALSQVEVCPGIFFNTDKESIEQLVTQCSGPLKFFVNYAGWGAGQLEGEIEAGGWVTTPAGPTQVFGDVEHLWHAVLKLADRRSRLAGIDPKLIPDDPSVN